MSGTLTRFFQDQFEAACPKGWTVDREVCLLPPQTRKLLGYSPRADVVMTRDDGMRRLWIEFEVSRADPVANHAKFATSHLFHPQPETDAFVAMVSPHVARGRANLAANTVQLMRRLGMDAFQTILLPQYPPSEIKRINHLSHDQLRLSQLDVAPEIERALVISEALQEHEGFRLFFTGNVLEAILNLHRWNDETATETGQFAWGKRVVTYFLFDPVSCLFAPSKYCAYLAIPRREPATSKLYRPQTGQGMTLSVYSRLDQSTPLFDGGRARQHFTKRLGLQSLPLSELPSLQALFDRWHDAKRDCIGIHPSGPVILLPSNTAGK